MEDNLKLKIQIMTETTWRDIGEIRLLEPSALGLNARSEFSYNLDYAIEYPDSSGWRAVSVANPVTTVPIEYQQWPPFLLDLFPQGAALQYVVEHYRILDRPENYWKILHTARLNPPGNLRVFVEGMDQNLGNSTHPGFTKQEVIQKGPDFLEYMMKTGAPVTGATGAGGAAPKFLLREDWQGRFHADGVLADNLTKACWLVKFRRGTTRMDTDILRVEKVYYDLAEELNLRTFGKLTWDENCLFVPRFDRILGKNRIKYLGMESFYSMVGRADFGSRLRHETYLEGLAEFSTDSEADQIEYCLRDFLNQMLGNTDNHGRNQSLIKSESSTVLAPIYDVAPMKFDPEGIVRNTRWDEPIENGDISQLTDLLVEQFGVDKSKWDRALNSFLLKSRRLDRRLKTLNVPASFVAGTKRDRDMLLNQIQNYCEN